MVMRRDVLAVVLVMLAAVLPAGAQSWFLAYDGTTDFACTTTADGNNAFFQTPEYLEGPDNYWEITSNGEGGKCLRQVDTSSSEALRWKGYGTRPEFYRGPCNSFAMENLVPGRYGFTVAFRLKAESYVPLTSDPEKIKRLFNCEFETDIRNPYAADPAYPNYQFRFEFGLKKVGSDICLYDFRSLEKLCILRTGSTTPTWHTIWATAYLPDPLNQVNCIYRLWADGAEVVWQDRNKGGWSDCEFGWDGADQTGTLAFDYFCYTYGSYLPGSISIPGEKSVVTTNSVVVVKQQPDGTPVRLTDKVITGKWTDPSTNRVFYYVEEDNGRAGIKIQFNTGLSPKNTSGQNVTVNVGDRITVDGGIGSAECEKQIFAHYITRTQTGQSVPAPVGMNNKSITDSYNTALRANDDAQILAAAAKGIITGLTADTITDNTKNWPVNCWKNATVYLPRTGSRAQARYYYVISNTATTLKIAHRTIYLVPTNITAQGVAVGDPYEFVGGKPLALSSQGLRISTWGRVKASNPIEHWFDVDDGSGSGDTVTLQDIWDTFNFASYFTPPRGIRIYYFGALPADNQYVSVVGCEGSHRYRYQQSTTINGSIRDEVKIDKVMPVVWAESWRLCQ